MGLYGFKGFDMKTVIIPYEFDYRGLRSKLENIIFGILILYAHYHFIIEMPCCFDLANIPYS